MHIGTWILRLAIVWICSKYFLGTQIPNIVPRSFNHDSSFTLRMDPSKGAIDEICASAGLYAWRLVSYAGLKSSTGRLLTTVESLASSPSLVYA